MTVLGLDPGRDKCGLAVMDREQVIYHQIVNSDRAIMHIQQLVRDYNPKSIVIGDGTTSSYWREKIESELTPKIGVVTVDEKNSTLEARDRYWLMYPPKGLRRIMPQGLLIPPRPIDDIVAILLIERYYQTLDNKS